MDVAAEFLDEIRAFGTLIAANDPAVQVPTCPGWSLQQLFRHVGRGDRWAAQMVLDRATEALDPRAVPDGKPPAGGELEWLTAGSQKLLDSVEQTGADVEIWTFLGPRPASWWIRRRLHEVLVHRADAALAVGQPFEVSAELAADAISEWLDIATQDGSVGAPAALKDGQSIHLHATDDALAGAGEWTVTRHGDIMAWSHEHGKGTVALRGTAVALLLVLTGRQAREDAGIQTFGDEAVWQSWVDHVTF
ncbi:maleylpyruvate isomerase family mycothiol-dependent enzyme [soil metagenome]